MKDLNIASDFNLVDSVSVSVPWMHLEQCRLNNADNYQDSVQHLIVIQTDTQHRLRLEWSRYMVIQLLEAKGSFWKHNYTIEITNIIAPLIQSRWVLHQIVCCVLHFDLLKFWDFQSPPDIGARHTSCTIILIAVIE